MSNSRNALGRDPETLLHYYMFRKKLLVSKE